MTMDVRDLQLLDWLIWDDVTPCQVTAIGCDYIETTKCGITLAESHLLKGVPLTDEILKKNFPSTTNWYFIGTNKFCFRIDKYKDKWDLYFGRDGKGTNLQIKISYVHELQHAMRLCGIDKEIEI